ncbi:MAG: hypothetical protein AAB539_04630 [Patescibacteria group bacterium]
MRILIASDVDGVLRYRKEPLAPELERAILDCRDTRGSAIMVHRCLITAAPLAHLPRLGVEFGLAESGGIIRYASGETFTFDQGTDDILRLREFLGIAVENGPETLTEGRVIIEGIRRTSLTLLFGAPPHYAGIKTAASVADVLTRIQEYINASDARLHIYCAATKSYEWIDVMTWSKERAISLLIAQMRYDKMYYLGDGTNDLPVMQRRDVIPVGFTNSIAEIRDLAEERGIFINREGPLGGAEEFFRLFAQNRLLR